MIRPMIGLPVWLNVLLVVGLACLGVLEARRLAHRREGLDLANVTRRAPYLYGVAGAVALLLGALFSLQYFPRLWWHLPLLLEYVFTCLVWGSVLALFSFLAGLSAAVAQISGHPERHKLVVASVLLVAAVQLAQWLYTRPVAPELTHLITSEGIILQSSGVSCAAASAANMARHHGRKVTEKQMAALLGTTTLGGTSASQVVYGMARIGFSCRRVKVPATAASRLKLPAMIFVDHPLTGPESHAAALIKTTSGRVEVWDPLWGKRLWSSSELTRRWHGFAIECIPSGPAPWMTSAEISPPR